MSKYHVLGFVAGVAILYVLKTKGVFSFPATVAGHPAVSTTMIPVAAAKSVRPGSTIPAPAAALKVPAVVPPPMSASMTPPGGLTVSPQLYESPTAVYLGNPTSPQPAIGAPITSTESPGAQIIHIPTPTTGPTLFGITVS